VAIFGEHSILQQGEWNPKLIRVNRIGMGPRLWVMAVELAEAHLSLAIANLACLFSHNWSLLTHNSVILVLKWRF